MLDERVSIVQADVLEWAEGYEGKPFHAILCDPPLGTGTGILQSNEHSCTIREAIVLPRRRERLVLQRRQ